MSYLTPNDNSREHNRKLVLYGLRFFATWIVLSLVGAVILYA